MQIQLPQLRTDSKSMTSHLPLKSACKSSSSKPKSIKFWQLRVSTPLMSPKTKVYNRTPTIRPSSCFCSQKMIACCCRLEVLSTRSSCMTHPRLLKNWFQLCMAKNLRKRHNHSVRLGAKMTYWTLVSTWCQWCHLIETSLLSSTAASFSV